jgi:hypothetical protein
MSHGIRRTSIIAFAALLVSAFALPTSQAKPFDPGFGDAACGDGTVHWTPAKVWPPNHSLNNVTISYDEPSNDGDTLTLTVDSITHDEEGFEKGSTAKHEPDSTGTGATDSGVDSAPPAAADSPTVVVQVNAERLAKPKDGRTYTITVSCADSGDAIVPPATAPTAQLTVFVPHSRKHA